MTHLKSISKIFIFILIYFFVTSCGHSTKKDLPQKTDLISEYESDKLKNDESSEKQYESHYPKIEKHENCNVKSLFSTNKDSKDSLFNDIEVRLKNDSIFGGVTISDLNDFFNSIDEKEFIKNFEFSKEYEFNRFPAAYTSDISCEDIIYLQFLKNDCSYRLSIGNNFHVEDFGCSEHQTIYTFKIIDNQIEVTDIAFAG